jgi:hypothetical protein
MSLCAVCSSPAPHKCAACKSVFYCSPAHQKEDWKAHRKVCPRLAQEAKDAEELLLRITTCLAQNGYHTEVGVMVQLNKAFWTDEQIWDAFKDVPGRWGKTRLMYASEFKDIGRLRWFLKRGARVETACRWSGQTALMNACQRGHLEVVRELLGAGRGPHWNAARPDDGRTALMDACQNGYLGIVRELLGKGADVNAAMKDDGTFLGRLRGDGDGHTMIRRAAMEKENGTRPPSGATALMFASLAGGIAIIRELLNHGANKKAKTSTGHTAFDVATGDRKEVIQELLKP